MRFVKRFLRNRLEALVDRRVNDILAMSALDVAIDVATGNQIEGDYLEFGVSAGKSFIRAYKRFKAKLEFYNLTSSMRFFAFDSFLGLPHSDDPMKPVQYREGTCRCSQAVFLSNLKASGVDLSAVIVVNRWYDALDQQVKRSHRLEKASVVYLDCDLYESARDALTFVSDLVQDGTMIVIDDYYRYRCSPNAGVRKAWAEFLSKNQHLDVTRVHNYRRVAFALNVKGVRPSLRAGSCSLADAKR